MELSNELIGYRYNDKYGTLEQHQRLPTVPKKFRNKNTASEVVVTRNGKFIYVGNRGHNSIAVFSIDDESGVFSFVDYVSTQGDHPRNFRLDPTEQFLIVANAFTDNVVVFKIDQDSGLLESVSEINVPDATCIRFAPIH